MQLRRLETICPQNIVDQSHINSGPAVFLLTPVSLISLLYSCRYMEFAGSCVVVVYMSSRVYRRFHLFHATLIVSCDATRRDAIVSRSASRQTLCVSNS